MMRSKNNMLTTLLIFGLVVGLAGCGGDDTENPGTVPTDDTMILDNATAEEFSVQALEIVNSLVVGIPAVAEGDFSTWAAGKAGLEKAGTDEVTWDPAQDAWVLDFAGPMLEMPAPSYWNVSYDLWVQYRGANGPMQYPLGATEVAIGYGLGMDMHMVDDSGSSDMVYEMNTDFVVSYLDQDGTYGVVGTGNTVVEVDQVSGQGSESGTFTLEWEMDVVATDTGCPTGTVGVTVQQFSLSAVYDGQGNVNWILVGPNYQASGTDTMSCGQPAVQ